MAPGGTAQRIRIPHLRHTCAIERFSNKLLDGFSAVFANALTKHRKSSTRTHQLASAIAFRWRRVSRCAVVNSCGGDELMASKYRVVWVTHAFGRRFDGT